MRVLIIEDDKMLAEMYRDGFEAAKHKVISAHGAQDALNKLDLAEVDLILLDLILPGRSGIEVIHELNSYKDWQKIPIILMTDNHPSTFKIAKKDLAKYSVEKIIFKQKTTPREVVKLAEEIAGESV